MEWWLLYWHMVDAAVINTSNLVNNTGVVSADVQELVLLEKI